MGIRSTSLTFLRQDGLLRRLPYDGGKEMAKHEQLTEKTGVKVYFADPHAPWQRRTNENINELIYHQRHARTRLQRQLYNPPLLCNRAKSPNMPFRFICLNHD
jgi:hypothetical protein